MNICFVYILKCADDSYYIGYADDMESRMLAHQAKAYGNCYTATRLPVKLIFVKEFPSRDEAFRFERQIKGWSRAKKDALIAGGFEAVKALSQKK
ncbi:MAG: GIY-YIG nuclease family protein [Candidatus Babeliales bacterium]|nr:GIY-YIG nuclease family protein [Candidatus Babeliales bacterium]